MSKIYIVKSSSGVYEDYHCWNEKAFTKREDAEAYAKELDKAHRFKPHFITDEFENLIAECESLIPDWEPFPDFPVTDRNRDAYAKWVEDQTNKWQKALIDMMYQKGQYLTEEMYAQYTAWEDNQYEDWHDCTVEELELL